MEQQLKSFNVIAIILEALMKEEVIQNCKSDSYLEAAHLVLCTYLKTFTQHKFFIDEIG